MHKWFVVYQPFKPIVVEVVQKFCIWLWIIETFFYIYVCKPIRLFFLPLLSFFMPSFSGNFALNTNFAMVFCSFYKNNDYYDFVCVCVCHYHNEWPFHVWPIWAWLAYRPIGSCLSWYMPINCVFMTRRQMPPALSLSPLLHLVLAFHWSHTHTHTHTDFSTFFQKNKLIGSIDHSPLQFFFRSLSDFTFWYFLLLPPPFQIFRLHVRVYFQCFQSVSCWFIVILGPVNTWLKSVWPIVACFCLSLSCPFHFAHLSPQSVWNDQFHFLFTRFHCETNRQPNHMTHSWTLLRTLAHICT